MVCFDADVSNQELIYANSSHDRPMAALDTLGCLI
jgi:hypothetical protein